MLRRPDELTEAFRAALAGMLAMAAAMGVGRFVYTPILPHMIEEGALDAQRAGIVAGFNFLGYLLGALAASAPAFGRRRRFWFLAGLSASVLTTVAMAWSGNSLAAMAAIRFASGVASAYALIFVSSIAMARFAEAGRPGLAALHFGGVGLGIAASAAIVTLAASLGAGWQAMWLATAVASLVALLASARLLPDSPPPAASSGGAGAQRALPGALWVLIASYGLFGFGYVVMATFLNAMAKADPALAPVEPWVWMIVGLAGMPSIWLWNRLAARSGILAAYAAACVVEAGGVSLSVLFVHPAALIVSALLLGGTFMAITALGLAHAREMAPGNPGRAIAVMTAAFGLGQMVGPVVAGQLYERHGDFLAASLCAALALGLAAALAHALRSAPIAAPLRRP